MEGIQTINALKAVVSSLPAQTTIPSGELVTLYAADGTPIAKISRDDLVKAVASVMASNSQNTFSKLLGVQANGTPMGIGASDLASVLGVSFLGSRGRFDKCEVGSYLSLGNGLYICGCVATDYSGGSVYIAFKQANEDFVMTRLDSGTMYGANHNSGGTFLPDANGVPEGKEAYAWYLRLA